MKTKRAEFHLPIFKQGDDVREELKQAKGNNYKALIRYAERLDVAATLCKALAAEVKGKRNIEIDGDTQFIRVEGPESWIDQMVETGLLDADPDEEEVE
jgi:hypothetical protein